MDALWSSLQQAAQIGGQIGGQIAVRLAAGLGGVQRISGAADHDPLAKREQALRLAPAGQIVKCVSADQAEELVFRGEGTEQRGQRVQCVVGLAVGAGSIQRGRRKARVFAAQQLHHGHAVRVSGVLDAFLQRLRGDGSEKHAVQVKLVCRGPGNGQVAQVRRIEAAAEEGYPHGDYPAWAAAFCCSSRRSKTCFPRAYFSGSTPSPVTEEMV